MKTGEVKITNAAATAAFNATMERVDRQKG